MEEIKRVPESVSGVKDGVQASVNCVHTIFQEEQMQQTILPCTVMASWENGVVSINFTAKGQRQMVGVRIDELLMLLQEANTARIDAEKESIEQ